MKSARNLFVLHAVHLGLSVATFVGLVVLARSFGPMTFLGIRRAETWLWLGLAIVGLVLLVRFARECGGGSAQNHARVAVGLAVFGLVLALPLTVLRMMDAPLRAFDGIRQALVGLRILVDAAGQLALWLALRHLSTSARSRTLLFLTLLGAGLLLSEAFAVAPQEALLSLYRSWIGSALVQVPFALGCAASLVLILTLRELGRGPAPAVAPLASAVVSVSPSRDLLLGSLWLGGGLLVTLVSFAAASDGGGHYVVTTGAIAYGLLRLGRGLVRASA